MFSAKNVMADIQLFRHYTDERKKEKLRMIQLNMAIRPLTPELATDISPSMQHDLFTKATRKGAPAIVAKGEMYDVKFKFKIPHQAMTLRMHAEVETGVVVDAVTVKKVRARRAENDEIYTVLFEAHFERPDPADLYQLTSMLADPVAVSFEKSQMTLPTEPSDEPAAAETQGTLH